jgi:RNA-directed DNA polymerase
MNSQREDKPPTVPETATQDGSVWLRWSWVERAAWTDRMLTALEVGVKGNVWFSLIDKVFSERNLNAAACKVVANKGAAGVDHVTVEEFSRDQVRNVKHLSDRLREGTYRPQPVKRVYIPKPGSPEKRPLGIPTVQNRVVQAAIRQVLEPIFEHEFAPHSYGFRPQRGCKDALRRVDELLKRGYVYVVDADLKSYFDTIPHQPLLRRVGERIADKRVLSLIESFLKAGIMDGLKEWTPEEGAPQGAVLSPLLSNVYLNPLDHQMASQGFEMVRYADDFVILCRSVAEAQQALLTVQQWTARNGLTLHPSKTRIVDTRTEAFDFLGYRFQQGKRFPRPKSLQKLKERLRAKTKRTNGQSLPVIIASLTPTLRGWFTYFQHCYKTSFPQIDSWTRGRLRSILRKRSGRRGRGRGIDHQRWPNTYFAKLGLFSLKDAHAQACQSCRR